MNFLGFTIGRKKPEETNTPSVVAPEENQGAIEIAPGGAYGMFVDLEGKAKNETELVNKYREMSVHPECDEAIQDIVNEAIVYNGEGKVLDIVLDDTDLPENIKKSIREEFDAILSLLNFNNHAYDLFKKWYVDGRLYFHNVIDQDKPTDGLKAIKYIDPRRIRKVVEPVNRRDEKTGATLYYGTKEYYIYNGKGVNNHNQTNGIRIAPDSITFVHSNLFDTKNILVYSHLHKAIKPLNQLRMLEDAVVIYRLARAPERRVWNVDVGSMPKIKAEQYVRDLMTRHKNKLIYDQSTGQVKDDRKFMTMLEDYWLPKREGGRGTDVTTLPGGQNLGEMEDVEYFRRLLYKSLNVPVTRIDSENQFNLGRASEITRDELKFNKFIKRLRKQFTHLFHDLLEIQLSLKGVMRRKEYREIKQKISFEFVENNHATELKETEIWSERMRLLSDVDQYVGTYFSRNWVKKTVLRMSEEEIKDMEKEMKDDTPKDEDDSGGFNLNHYDNEQPMLDRDEVLEGLSQYLLESPERGETD